jgi:hypothetical protein
MPRVGELAPERAAARDHGDALDAFGREEPRQHDRDQHVAHEHRHGRHGDPRDNHALVEGTEGPGRPSEHEEESHDEDPAGEHLARDRRGARPARRVAGEGEREDEEREDDVRPVERDAEVHRGEAERGDGGHRLEQHAGEQRGREGPLGQSG